MNKKVRINLIASIGLIGLFSLGFLSNNAWGFLIASVADSLLIAYVIYLINYQKNLNIQKTKRN
jgi:hypothetical protein